MERLYTHAKQEFPELDDEDIMSKVEEMKAAAPEASEDELAQGITEAKKSEMVNNMVRKKYNIGDYSAEKRQSLASEVDDAKDPLAAALAGFGAGIRGESVQSAFNNVLDTSQQNAKRKLSTFDKNKELALLERESDPLSEESVLAQRLAKDMGYDGDLAKLTAAQFKKFSPVMQKKFDLEARKQLADQASLDREESRKQRELDRNLTREELALRKDQQRDDRLAKEAKLSDKHIEAFTDIDNASSDLNNLMAKLGDNSSWTGPVDGRVPDFLADDDQVAWRSALGKYKDAYRQAITGAGAGPREIAILEKRLPSETDTFENFKAKAQEAVKELQRRKQLLASNLEKGGKNVSQFKDTAAPTGKVKVSNGQKTFEIDAADLADAEKDGFKRI